MLGSQPGRPWAGPALPSSGPARTLAPAHLELAVQRRGPLPSPTPAGPPTRHQTPSPAAPPALPHLSTAGPGPVLAVGTIGARSPPQAPWHLPQPAGTRTGIGRRTRSHASPRGMLFPTVLSPCCGMSVGTPLLHAGPLCAESGCCGAVPAVGATPARPCPCPCQSPGEAAAASAALTQLNPAQQQEMETRHSECQLWTNGRVGFRSLGVSFSHLSYSSSQPFCLPTLYHTRGATALGSGRPWG